MTLKSASRLPRSLPEALARSLRHELGDLLQTIYATVAIFQKRLPPDWELERRILTDMRSRAEACKNLLDAVHDFACPTPLSFQRVNLAEVAASVVQAAAKKRSSLDIRAEAAAAPVIQADAMRVTQVAESLLENACDAAQRQVRLRTGEDAKAGQAEWVVTDDGPGVPVDQTDRLFSPFFTTRHGHTGLGLAMARKLVELHGGSIEAGNL